MISKDDLVWLALVACILLVVFSLLVLNGIYAEAVNLSIIQQSMGDCIMYKQ